MNCAEFVELVTDYLEGSLDPATRQRFTAHLAECPGCDRYLEQIRQTIAELGQVSLQHLSPQARSALLDAFRDWHRDRR